jgi:DNA-binding protein H-NS
MVVGKDCKKRRKLNLTTTDRVQPTLSPSQAVRWYIGREKLAAPDVFYKDLDRESGSDSDDFTFMRTTPVAIGKHLFVKQQMQHYFRQPLREVTKKDGQKSMAIFPYEAPQDLNTPRYFTLFSKDSGSVIATKEDVADWPELDQRPDGFHGLLQKYPPKEEEDVLPAYGDSGSEGDYDSDTWKEMEEEKIEEKTAASQLPKILRSVDVEGTIADCVAGFVSTWHLKYRPAQERKARNLWVKSRKTRTVHTKIKNAALQIALLDQRLKKLEQAVRENQWSKVEEIKQQCQVMEHTVFDRELQKWKISVLELETRPPKPPPLPLPPRKPKPPKPSFDEESLSSDNPVSSDDDMSDFIVPDDSPKKPAVTPVKPSPKVLPDVPPMHLDSEDDEEPVTPYRKQKLFGSARKSLALGGRNTISPASSSRPQWKKTVPPNIDVVDLTVLSDSEPPAETKTSENTEPKASDGAETEGFEVHTPPLNPVGMVKSSPHTKATATSGQLKSPQGLRNNDVLPPLTDVKGLLRLDWNILEEKQDRKRLLTKLVATLSRDDREKLRSLLNRLVGKRQRRRIKRGLKALLAHEKTLKPYGEDESNTSLRMTALFTSWFVCRHLLAEQGIHKDHLKRAEDAKNEDLKLFCSELSAALQLCPAETPSHKHPQTMRVKASGSPNKQHPSPPVLIEGSDYESSKDSQVGSEIRTPRKKRKRPVQQSQEAMDVQRSGQRRVKQEERKRQQLAKQLETGGVGNSDPGRQAVSFDNPVIYLDPRIGLLVKPHQLDGIQFMWRELIKDEKQQGCLLAHTMGLGKTMQV